MQYAELKQAGIRVSRFCVGCWGLSPQDFTWGGTPLEDAVQTIVTAFDRGINFFDTAEAYGKGGSEEVLALALKQIPREQIVIASKASPSHFRANDLKEACHASLRRLGTDYIDLYQLHWPSPSVPIEETWQAMEELQRDGKIRALAVSNFGVSYLRELLGLNSTVPASNQLNYSLFFRAIEFEVLPFCRQHGIPVLCYSPLNQGLLANRFETTSQVPPERARTRLFSPERPHARHHGPNLEPLVDETLKKL
ncbi:MAG: aldo/keto reductase, partial [Lentisphaerae bacterium]